MDGRRAKQSEYQARDIESKEPSTDGRHKVHTTPKRTTTCRIETVAEFTLMKDNVRRKESVANVVSAITLLKFVVDSQNSSRMKQKNILKNILKKNKKTKNILKNR